MNEIANNLLPFKPHPLVPGGHLQTIVGYYLPGANHVRSTKRHHIHCGDGDQLVVCENRPNRKAPFKKIIVFMHGLGGDANSPYMLRLAHLFQNRGWTVFRMNHRGCGDGHGLAKSTYHSGKSDDVSRVLLKIADLHPGIPMLAVGLSLSGNALLKLLGQAAEAIPPTLRGAIAVTPPIELSRCADALGKPQNRIYDRRFVRVLKTDIAERQRKFPDFPDLRFPRGCTLRHFDEICTAPLHGFASAEDYYTQCSAKQFLAAIKTPTVLLASQDDPFIPPETFTRLPENDIVTYHITRHGGHMGFVSANNTPLGTRRWMDYAILAYSEGMLRHR